MALLHKLRRNLAGLIDPESELRREPPRAAKVVRAFSAEMFCPLAIDEGGVGDGASALAPPLGTLPSLVDAGTVEPFWPAPSLSLSSARKTRDPLAELRFSYRPSWDPSRGVIAAYLCAPTLPEAPGGVRRKPAALVLKDDVSALEKLDFAVLSHGIGVVEGFVSEHRHLLMTIPVRFETLSVSAHCRRYVELLRTRLSPEAASLLVVELVGLPGGVPEARLLDISSPLRAHTRAVIARLRPEITDFSPFAAARVAAVGSDLSDQSGSELALMRRLARFGRNAAGAGVATYLRGIGSLSLAAAALGAGFAHIDGDAVAPMVDQPHSVVPFGLLDLYNPAFKG